MAKIKYAAGLIPLLNKHFGAVFQPNNTSQTMKSDAAGARTRWTRQTQAQQHLMKAIRFWRDMPIATKSNWVTFAATYPQASRRNPAIFLTGYQLFLKRNHYCFLNHGITCDFLEEPTLEELPEPVITVTIESTDNVLDVTEHFIKNFGIIPEPGQFLLIKIFPMSESSGQFFAPIEQTIEITESYIDGLFVSFVFAPTIRNMTFSVYLSKVVYQSTQYVGTKVRYMGCFTPKRFDELLDVPDGYTGNKGKIPKVKDTEDGLEYEDITDLGKAVFENKCGLMIYDEDNEWGHTVLPAEIVYDDDSDPFNKLLAIKATNTGVNTDCTFTAPDFILHADHQSIIIYVKLEAILAASQDITCIFLNEGEHCSDEISFGIDKNLLDEYQTLIIPFSSFAFDLDEFDAVSIVFRDLTEIEPFPILFIDYIALLSGTEAPDCTCFCPPIESGGLTCEDLPDCPTIITINEVLENILEVLIPSEGTSIPPVHFGLLYNRAAVYHSPSILNSGFEIPTRDDILDLWANKGGASACGGHFKEEDLTYWNSPNVDADNTFKTNGRGPGVRFYNGQFYSFKNENSIFIAYPLYPDLIQTCTLARATNADQLLGYGNIRYGMSLRAINRNHSLLEGEAGIYLGNDGRAYRTICLNGLEWIADNLAETKYVDGSAVVEIVNSAEWAIDEDGGMCAPYNDWNYV